MYKIKIDKWKAKVPVVEDGVVVDYKEADEDLLIALNNLVGGKKPEEMPRGIDKFRIFSKISLAFEKADKTGVLELEDREYTFLKDTVNKDVPAAWGMNKNIMKAVTAFLEAKDE